MLWALRKRSWLKGMPQSRLKGMPQRTLNLQRKHQNGLVLHHVTNNVLSWLKGMPQRTLILQQRRQIGGNGHPAYCAQSARQCLLHRSQNPRSGTSLASIHSTPMTPTIMVSPLPLMNFSPLTLRQSLVRLWTGPTTMPSLPPIGFLPPSRRSQSPNVRHQRLLHSNLMCQMIASNTILTFSKRMTTISPN